VNGRRTRSSAIGLAGDAIRAVDTADRVHAHAVASRRLCKMAGMHSRDSRYVWKRFIRNAYHQCRAILTQSPTRKSEHINHGESGSLIVVSTSVVIDHRYVCDLC